MTKKNFLLLMEELLELDKGSLCGQEALDSLEGWDSLAIIGFLGMADRHYGVTLDPEKVVTCKNIDHLKLLVDSSV